MNAAELTQLFPPASTAQTITAESAYRDFQFARLATERRPYVVVNMVTTVDGQARVGANTAELGNPADAELFAALRGEVDCVMAGTRTIAAEGYKAPATTQAMRTRREQAGLAARPLFATATKSGNLPLQIPLFQDADAEVVVFSEASPDVSSAKARVAIVETTDPSEMLAALRRDFGVRSLLLEGGPSLNAALLSAELVDEFFLTLAPDLVGGKVPFPIVAGELVRQRLHLVSALLADDHLFMRFRVD